MINSNVEMNLKKKKKKKKKVNNKTWEKKEKFLMVSKFHLVGEDLLMLQS